jgi:hypothetical protein
MVLVVSIAVSPLLAGARYVLAALADTHDALMIILGTDRGGLMSAIDRVLGASVSARLIRHTHRPVVLVPDIAVPTKLKTLEQALAAAMANCPASPNQRHCISRSPCIAALKNVTNCSSGNDEMSRSANAVETSFAFNVFGPFLNSLRAPQTQSLLLPRLKHLRGGDGRRISYASVSLSPGSRALPADGPRLLRGQRSAGLAVT